MPCGSKSRSVQFNDSLSPRPHCRLHPLNLPPQPPPPPPPPPHTHTHIHADDTAEKSVFLIKALLFCKFYGRIVTDDRFLWLLSFSGWLLRRLVGLGRMLSDLRGRKSGQEPHVHCAQIWRSGLPGSNQ